MNGDGIDDFAFNTPSTPGSAGRAYVVYGKAASAFSSSFAATSLASTARFVLTGSLPTYPLSSVASDAGDWNGDGVADFLFASPQVNNNQGTAALLLGKDGGWSTDNTVIGMPQTQGAKLTPCRQIINIDILVLEVYKIKISKNPRQNLSFIPQGIFSLH